MADLLSSGAKVDDPDPLQTISLSLTNPALKSIFHYSNSLVSVEKSGVCLEHQPGGDCFVLYLNPDQTQTRRMITS